MAPSSNWITVAESQFPWEREALDFIRGQFPQQEPYRAWSNFEFIAGDGTISEVDLLVFTPQGFFLIEIKSRPGKIVGDQGTWTWENDGKRRTYDNPLIVTNRKAKKLRSLLERQRAFRNKGKVPFVESLVFCSDPKQQLDLSLGARQRVCLRDRPSAGDKPGRVGIMAAILRRDCDGLEPQPRDLHNRPISQLVAQAMDQAGIRPSQSSRKVSDYLLEGPMEGEEGPGYQDWRATHAKFSQTTRRIRFYLVRQEASQQDREVVERAANREFQILDRLQHPNILRCFGLTEHELGPALILEHDPNAIRLDHYLAQNQDALGVDVRLSLVRQIAEAMSFVHEQRTIHCGLSPRSILVTEPRPNHPKIKIFNWQLGYRAGSTAVGATQEVTATSHIDQLVDDSSTAYMAPEFLTDASFIGEHLDIFSLGAIAFHIFSGVPPATNGLELAATLRDTKGLQISAVLNGAPESLQNLIKDSTHPVVNFRTEEVADFLAGLDLVEEDLTAPDTHLVENPNDAQRGDVLPGRYVVVKRLGQGASSIGLLVQRAGQDQSYVLKVANDPDHNSKIEDEAEILQKLRHPNIVEFVEQLEIGNRSALLMKPVVVTKNDEDQIETLGQRLRREGQLHIDLLQRFGDDLLDAIKYLEEKGVNHRDIKPDNIAIGHLGRADKLHLVLFDFSLSRAPVDNIRAGTTGYLEPMLSVRKPPRWDLQAERYAAAVTLYEMATGVLPTWGDDASDPTYLDCEITLEPERLDRSLRDRLVEFFTQAFRRQPEERFDNAEEMLRRWRRCFEGIDKPGSLLDTEDESFLENLLAEATFATPLADLGLGPRATNALDLANLLTVEDLLIAPPRRLARLRGVGHLTRREILKTVKILRRRLGVPSDAGVEDEGAEHHAAVGQLSVDLLVQRLTKTSPKDGESVQRLLGAMLGLEASLADPWPSQADLARHLNLSRARVGQLVSKFQKRWTKEPAMTQLRRDLTDLLRRASGVMALEELAAALLVARGSVQDDPIRTQRAIAVLRAAVEVERSLTSPRFFLRRDGDRILLAITPELLSYGRQLGDEADHLAAADPLVSPGRSLAQIQAVPPPVGSLPLPDNRLLRLAAAASHRAALSSRQEFYPRGMEAERALRLAQGALYGVKVLSERQLRERVSSRYPEAQPLPDRPQLDNLMQAIAPTLVWNPSVYGGQGGYESPAREGVSITSSLTLSRLSTTPGYLDPQDITPEVADARQFEERLQRGIQEGSFLALLVSPQRYQQAKTELAQRFPVQVVDYEGLFLDCLRRVTDEAEVVWNNVLEADATPHEGNWNKLMLLVGRAMPLVEAELLKADRTILLIYPALLARYQQMTLLERLRESIGRPAGIPGLWVLVPNDQQAMVEGQAVPLLSPGQRARIPEKWLRNGHRGVLPSGSSPQGELL